jgi:hypothetical protein
MDIRVKNIAVVMPMSITSYGGKLAIRFLVLERLFIIATKKRETIKFQISL